MSLLYKAYSAHRQFPLLFFTLSPKETGCAYEKGQDYAGWKEHKHGLMMSGHSAFLPAKLFSGS